MFLISLLLRMLINENHDEGTIFEAKLTLLDKTLTPPVERFVTQLQTLGLLSKYPL